jgi:thiol-disulfide isomerase/thioredoxin
MLLLAAFLQSLLLCFLRVSGQSKGEGTPNPADYAALKPLTVGDTLQTAMVQVIAPAPQLLTIPHEEKLTLLYFWHTTCVSCWKKMPFYDSLLTQYEDKIQLITITTEPSEKLHAFMTRHPEIAALQLPMAAADSLLSATFPYLMVSHVVWVAPGGRVVAITGPGYVTAAHIDEALQKEMPDWTVKMDVSLFHRDQPLFTINPKAGYNLSPQSVAFTGWAAHLPGVSSGFYVQQNTAPGRMTGVNITLKNLFERVYRLPPFTHLWKIPDSLKNRFFMPDNITWEDWITDVSFCFELQWPAPVDKLELSRQVLKAIEEKFGITGKIDTISTPCWVLQGAGKPGGGLSLQAGIYRYNQQFAQHIVSEAQPGATCHTPPEFDNWEGFVQWCTTNGYTAVRKNIPLPFFIIHPIQKN